MSSEKEIGDMTASITLAWNPLIDTGGVPLTGYKLYAVDEAQTETFVYDGTDSPEIV